MRHKQVYSRGGGVNSRGTGAPGYGYGISCVDHYDVCRVDSGDFETKS